MFYCITVHHTKKNKRKISYIHIGYHIKGVAENCVDCFFPHLILFGIVKMIIHVESSQPMNIL